MTTSKGWPLNTGSSERVKLFRNFEVFFVFSTGIVLGEFLLIERWQ
jgi:hypothetical protein